MFNKIRIEIGICCHTGKIKRENQDRCGSFKLPKSNCFGIVVADGMGGHYGGGVAAEIARDSIIKTFEEKFKKSKGLSQNPQMVLTESYTNSFRKINERSETDNALSNMGTTLSIAVIKDNLLYTGHIGDSRIYKINSNSIQQISQDHSMVQEMVRTGLLSQEQAESHPSDNILLRALTSKIKDSLDIYNPIKIIANDRVLVCSDGLWKMIGDNEIQDIVLNSKAEISAKNLVETANRYGGLDNIGVAVIHVLS